MYKTQVTDLGSSTKPFTVISILSLRYDHGFRSQEISVSKQLSGQMVGHNLQQRVAMGGGGGCRNEPASGGQTSYK